MGRNEWFLHGFGVRGEELMVGVLRHGCLGGFEGCRGHGVYGKRWQLENWCIWFLDTFPMESEAIQETGV